MASTQVEKGKGSLGGQPKETRELISVFNGLMRKCYNDAYVIQRILALKNSAPTHESGVPIEILLERFVDNAGAVLQNALTLKRDGLLKQDELRTCRDLIDMRAKVVAFRGFLPIWMPSNKSDESAEFMLRQMCLLVATDCLAATERFILSGAGRL